MNARTFGTDDKQAEFFARYGVTSYEQAGEMFVTAPERDEWVKEQNRAHQARIAQAQRDFADTVSPRVEPASDRAVEYMVALWMERSDKATAEQVRAWGRQQNRHVVSDKITWLKAQPKLSAKTEGGALERHNVPAGRYAVTGNDGQTVFVKVDRPTDGPHKGKIFVKVQAGDELRHTSRGTADALLAKIAADGPREAMLRYGRQIGACGHCGRTLTNEESRAAGIGPVCSGKI